MIVVDTGPLVALANDRDQDHAVCQALLSGFAGPLLVPAPVVTEVCYMLESRRGPELEAAFLDDLAEGVLELVALERADVARMAELVRTYHDLPLGAADASVVAVAERFATANVATLDHRDFRVIRPHHVDALRLLPG